MLKKFFDYWFSPLMCVALLAYVIEYGNAGGHFGNSTVYLLSACFLIASTGESVQRWGRKNK